MHSSEKGFDEDVLRFFLFTLDFSLFVLQAVTDLGPGTG